MAKWLCQNCSWEGEHTELYKDNRDEFICPDCNTDDVLHENDVESEDSE